jgi:hypothetical protein
MAAFWAVFIFGGSGPAITAHGSLDLKQEIQIQIQNSLNFILVEVELCCCMLHRHRHDETCVWTSEML